jgi:hypothetical protein
MFERIEHAGIDTHRDNVFIRPPAGDIVFGHDYLRRDWGSLPQASSVELELRLT